jgi:hypothetical protein
MPRETVAVYCKNKIEHTNTQCGANPKFLDDEQGGTHSKHWALNGPCIIHDKSHKAPSNTGITISKFM